MIQALIITIALELGVPPNFMLAIALTENPTLDTEAVNHNDNGTNDMGVMQLNSAYFSHIDRTHPEQNIRAGTAHVKEIMKLSNVLTWWDVALVYNAGITRLKNPPKSSIEYANKVMDKYVELSNGHVSPLVRRVR